MSSRWVYEMSAKLELTLAAGPQAASAARVALEDLDQELGPPLLKDLRLMVSELVTNSIRHASPDPRDVVEMRAWLYDDCLRIEVSDGGSEFAPVATRGRRDEVGGWGLYIVESLASRWGVDRRGRRNHVWFEIDVRERRAPVSGSPHERSVTSDVRRGGNGAAPRRRPRLADERDVGRDVDAWAGVMGGARAPQAAA
ncbi:MAG: ATP-binding protein [Solirubrobacteraceae bacterium]